jgi:hypothetical protein
MPRHLQSETGNRRDPYFFYIASDGTAFNESEPHCEERWEFKLRYSCCVLSAQSKYVVNGKDVYIESVSGDCVE